MRAIATEVKELVADKLVSRILDILAVAKAEVLAVNRQAIHMLDIRATSAKDTVTVNMVRLEPSSFEEGHRATDNPSFKVAKSLLAEPL